MHILQATDFDVISDSLTVLYVSYLCANMQEAPLSEDEFYELIEFDLAKINIMAGELIQGKKK